MLRLRTLIPVSLIALLVTSAGAAAQADANQTAVRTGAFHNLATLPSVGSPSAPGVAISLDATSEDKVGKVAIVLAAPHRDDLTFSIGVSGPLDDESKASEPLSLDGLANAATADAGLHWFLWRGKPNIPEGQRICNEQVGRPDCDDDEITDPDQRLLFLRSQAANTDPITIDIEGAYSRNTFKFLDNASYQPGSESHSSGSFSLSLGRYTPKSGYAWAGYEFAHSWEAAGPPRQICTPLSGGALECRTSPVDVPTDSSKHLLKFGWRRFVLGGRAAIDPTLEWDTADSVAGFSLPLYAFTKKNEGLAGGVKVGWRSDSGDISAVVFVGNVLSILK